MLATRMRRGVLAAIAAGGVAVQVGCWRTEPPSAPPVPGPAEPAVRVSSMTALIGELDVIDGSPRRTIVLAPGDYQIDSLPRSNGRHHRWATVFEGVDYHEPVDHHMLVLEDLHDVTIRAEDPTVRPRLLTGISSATVLVLENCSNVTLQDLEIGHSVEGTCGGGVVMVLGGSNVRIVGCALSGSGTFGIETYRTRDLHVASTRIFHTSEGAIRLSSTEGADIVDTVLDHNHTTSSFVTIAGSRGVTFDRLVVRDNHFVDTAVEAQAVFSAVDSTGTLVRDTKVLRNTAEYLVSGAVVTEAMTVRGNTWVHGVRHP